MFVSGVIDFTEQLRRQLSFLKNSNEFYDRGQVEEALRIAVTLRVIFHNTKVSTSLLNHLNGNPLLLSTAAPFDDEDGKTPSLYLVNLIANLINTQSLQCLAKPLLASRFATRSIDIDTWWNKEVVIDLKDGKGTLCRRELVLAEANNDGGAHVDSKLEPRYQNAREGAGLSIEIDFKGGIATLAGSFQHIHYASLRQISYEVLNSPALVSLAGK